MLRIFFAQLTLSWRKEDPFLFSGKYWFWKSKSPVLKICQIDILSDITHTGLIRQFRFLKVSNTHIPIKKPNPYPKIQYLLHYSRNSQDFTWILYLLHSHSTTCSHLIWMLKDRIEAFSPLFGWTQCSVLIN